MRISLNFTKEEIISLESISKCSNRPTINNSIESIIKAYIQAYDKDKTFLSLDEVGLFIIKE